MIEKILHRITPYIGFVMFLVAIVIMHHELKVHNIAEIAASLEQMPIAVILLGILLTGINYLCLTGYDFMALRYLGRTVRFRNVILASLISFSISNTTGQALISGASMRYRFYSLWGLSGMDIIKFSLFISLMYVLGATTIFSISTVTSPGLPGASLPLIHTVQLLAWSTLAALAVYWSIILFRKKPFIVRGMELSLPGPGLSLAQTIIAVIDLLLSSFILYLFIHVHGDISFPAFLAVYIAAQILGLFSQIPGGLGVFEGSFIYLLGTSIPTSSVFGALIVFRLVYYFVPLVLSGAGLLIYELLQHRTLVKTNAQATLGYLSMGIPHIFSILLVLSGGLLLVSGSTPTDRGALKWLYETLPLSVVEASHMIGSIVGLLLLFMARAVRLRIDAAYFGILLLLAIGAISSLLKGFDWQESLVLGILLLSFLPSRRFFYRKSSLFTMPFSWSWIAFVGVVLIGATWIGLFSYKHVEYTNDLWWRFTYRGDAPRFLRSSLILAMMMLSFCFYRMLRIRPEKAHLPTQAEMDALEPIVHSALETQSHLALIGDKSLLWGQSKDSFLMYGTTQKYWIAMGDPVGRLETHESLVWRFRELADKNGAKIAFYQVSREHLPLYLDLGLVLIKLGEEARVSLKDFNLKGGKRSGLRTTNNKFAKLGLEFRILEREQVKARMDELHKVSDAWLKTRKTSEKGFSLGFFSEPYLCRSRCGVVMQEDTIIAFANLWETDSKEEMSIDLMRYTPDALGGIMEYLFIQLMLWGKNQEYRWFNLGMSPLSGFENHPLAPMWHKIGNAIFKYGDNFYNFEGLRAYKEKFDPIWQPRYLAAPAFSAPTVLLNIAGMIAGSWKGIFVK
ncbi:MAG: bifunctional lysylphosphatidylglycerol flippase/synthetase MprF [Desulfoplanes sp.]|nr:bifunctional lysylphosphatidylglycerol flippase/synthetase MprF [Desulfoplanes sp.]